MPRFVRSPHACADVKSVDTKAALAIKGVIAVITAADIKAANVGNLSQHPPVAGRGGAKLVMPVRPALVGDRVRHIGEAVAMVIAETFAAAQDGAEAVEVEYDALDAVTDVRAAMKSGAPQVWERRRTTSPSIGRVLPPIPTRWRPRSKRR